MDASHTPGNLAISFMPELLPDELLYSFLGRMCAGNALGSTRERMRLLFGADHVMPVVDLPTRLEYLHVALGANSPWASAAELINCSTMYPYHRPFLTVERNAAVQKILLGASGKSLKTLLGRVANRFGAAPHLRFCPLCSTADSARYGAPYWHCAHQLPGVTVCTIHRANLVEHLMPSQRTDRQRIILAPSSFAIDPPPIEPQNKQIAFAILSSELFAARLPVLENAAYQDIYRDAAFSMGLKRKGRVDYPELSAALRTHYGGFEGFPHRDRLLATPRNPSCWLRPVIERPNRASHPICHLLLIGFLFGTVEQFRQRLLSNTRPASDPSLLGMPVGLQSVPSLLDEELLYDTSLSCREVARLTNLSVTTIVTRRRNLKLVIAERPKTPRPGMDAKIMAMLEQGAAPSQTAAACHASLSMVYRLKGRIPDVLKAVGARRFEGEREKRRERWSQLLANSKGMGVTTIRKKSPDTFAWLYRNDRQWLRNQSETFRVARTTAAKVDWVARDSTLCSRVLTLVRETFGSSERPRVSRSLMMQHVGDASVRRNLARLPKLALLLDAFEESVATYQHYRIDSALASIRERGEPPRTWRVQRSAGIRNWTSVHEEYLAAAMKSFEPKNYNG